MLMFVTVRTTVSRERGTKRYETNEASSKNDILRLDIVFSEHLATMISTKLNIIIHNAFFPILGSKESEEMPWTIVENNMRVIKDRIGIYSSNFFISSLNNSPIIYSHSQLLKGKSSFIIFFLTSSVLTLKYSRSYWVNIFDCKPEYLSKGILKIIGSFLHALELSCSHLTERT